MPATTQLNIDLPDELAAELRAAVACGEYASIGAAVRAALLAWQLRRQTENPETEELRDLIQAGMASGPGIDADLVFTALRAEFSGAREG